MSNTITGAEPKETKTFFGHPRMLANLFTVEMWERFSFYGMQGIMIYYLYYTADKGGLGLDKDMATGVIGAYGAVVYLMTILGGILGDRLLGPERTLFYSAIGIMAGHISLSLIPGVPGVVIGLLLVAIGSGGLKSNASVLVGSLYGEHDSRRDAGFTIFYIGINTGALLGPILTGWGWNTWGFHMGFGFAAIGMAAGLIQYSLTRKPDGKGYRIAVKREDGGQVSSWLHNHASEGDVVYLAAPAGDFFLNVEPQTPVTLLSGGVGQTPMLAMLDALAKSHHQGQVNWFHAAENGDVHAFADEVKALGAALPAFTSHVWYRTPTEADRQAGRFDSEGLMDLAAVADNIRAPQMQFYLCGPVAFMQFAAKQLVELGVNKDHIHYECFGPHKVL